MCVCRPWRQGAAWWQVGPAAHGLPVGRGELKTFSGAREDNNREPAGLVPPDAILRRRILWTPVNGAVSSRWSNEPVRDGDLYGVPARRSARCHIEEGPVDGDLTGRVELPGEG